MATSTADVAEDNSQSLVPTSYTLSNSLVALDSMPNVRSEGFRALRTHIMARHVEQGRRALVVCAATAGVGCTFVSSNLTLALSQIGVKTLLIDANMRSPGVDKLFRPSKPVPGLWQCLSSEDASFADFIQDEVMPNLSILFSGGDPPNPQELLATNRFADLMSYCLRDFDLTVIDTPPANTCSDVNRVSTVAGYSLVVASRDISLVADLRTLVRQLESDHARIVGTVMTEG
jgi:protein-tyrosine kinase